MADNKSTENRNDTFDNKNKIDKKPEFIILTFRQARSYGLKIGRKYYFFTPNESKKVPVSVLSHPDFTAVIRKNFSIKEA